MESIVGSFTALQTDEVRKVVEPGHAVSVARLDSSRSAAK